MNKKILFSLSALFLLSAALAVAPQSQVTSNNLQSFIISDAFAVAPQNAVLDNFNRANSTTTLGSSWTILFGTGTIDGISSNQAYNPTAVFTQYIAVYWNAGTFNANQEVFYDITTMPSNDSDNPAVLLRTNTPGASSNGYSFGPSNTTKTQVGISKIVAGAQTSLATASVTVVSGDSLWFTAVGTTLTGYVKHSGTWTQAVQVTDSTFTGVGWIAFYTPGNKVDGLFDNFGGGNYTTSKTTAGFFGD